MKRIYVGKTCPFCKTPFQTDDAVVYCGICEMPHHLSCWQANKGCTTFGCSGYIDEIINQDKVVNISRNIDSPTVVDETTGTMLHEEISEKNENRRYETIWESKIGKLQDGSEILIEKTTIIKDKF